jgi:hypothetical protein
LKNAPGTGKQGPVYRQARILGAWTN